MSKTNVILLPQSINNAIAHVYFIKHELSFPFLESPHLQYQLPAIGPALQQRLLGNIVSNRAKVTMSKGKHLPYDFGDCRQNSMNRCDTVAGLSMLRLNMHRDIPAEKHISGIGAQRSSTGANSKGGRQAGL